MSIIGKKLPPQPEGDGWFNIYDSSQKMELGVEYEVVEFDGHKTELHLCKCCGKEFRDSFGYGIMADVAWARKSNNDFRLT